MPKNDSIKAKIIDNFVAPKCHGFLEIIYQDDDILLINKPSGLLTLSGKNPLNWDSVHYRLVNGQKDKTPAFPLAKLPHRLDLGTSGIMVAALNSNAAKSLNKQFQTGRVEKRYIARLSGWLDCEQGKIEAPIAKDKACFPRVKICHKTGKVAISEYKVLQKLDQPQRSLVEFKPQTGRTHQLRIHSLAIGHPILGCDFYHNQQSQQLANRLQLHASELYFQHPVSGEQVHGVCEADF
jgi:tRNA pseudouridine32 synthase / 23S rRNA pseudouridine746 synthase